MGKKITTIEMSIDATKHDVSKLGADLKTGIDIVKMELSQNISVVRNEVTAVSNNAAKLANQKNSLMENKITTIDMSIDATKHDVSKLGADLKSVIDIVKMELSQNISVVRNEVTAVSNNAAKLANQTNSLMENKITTTEMSIDATKQDISKLGADLNTVIDIVLLDQAATCKPNCAYGDVCFRDNMCKCKPFTEGPRCGKVICDDKCYENGGKCVGPGKCKCPENRHGSNCEEFEETCPAGWILNSVSCYFFSSTQMTWTEADFDCNARGGYLMEVNSVNENMFLYYSGQASGLEYKSDIDSIESAFTALTAFTAFMGIHMIVRK
ncbi:versican core protein-like isoform X2 [Mercenaria mercenaria]|uniref:versican core protein-like isoform X2 n=1 Tax=Mercenaria mercenaria TaxID=6596 RepID=UPI00234F20BE|nr:versican core protein-like isoform X2 [Mercenaria mercenaria]